VSKQGAREIRPKEPPRTIELSRIDAYAINQVSASDIQAFHDCPRKFYLQRILRLGELIDRDPTNASNRGSLIHLLLEWGSNEQASTLFARNQIPKKDADEICAIIESFQKSAFMQDLYSSEKLVKEYAFYLRLSEDGQAPRYLKGFIDAMATQADDSLLIVDYKTGTGRVNVAGFQTQADCYGLAGLVRGAPHVQVVMVRPEVTDDQGEPETFRFAYERTQVQEMRQKLLALIDAMEDAENASLDAVDASYCARFCNVPVGLCPKVDQRVTGALQAVALS